jgi:hypothetical protein
MTVARRVDGFPPVQPVAAPVLSLWKHKIILGRLASLIIAFLGV